MSENNSLTFEKLKWFISQGKIQGWVSHMWFNGLRSRFPFDFLFYSQNHKEFNGFRKNTIQSLEENFNKMFEYILQSELEYNDIIRLEVIQEELREIYFNKKNIQNEK